MKTNKFSFFLAVILIGLIACAAFFGAGPLKGGNQMRYGIDIRGGIEAVFVPKDLNRQAEPAELETARAVIETRLDSKNILDREVTIDKSSGGVIVRFPWKSDEKEFNPEKAIAELGEMAQLSFRDPQGNILLDGKDIASSKAATDQQTGKAIVDLAFTDQGAKLFSDATGKLVGQQMSIYMDETLLSAPYVKQQITGGKAMIDGMQNMQEAISLSEKINSGSLPFSLETKNYSSISPTLGSGSLNVMFQAGAIAFVLICLFMLIKYRLAGLISCIALLLQLSGQILAISIPQITLTLPGIAGIILSLGMGVDANVIINERISEELRRGASLRGAIQKGYHNAFSSVLDGNLTTAIVAVILMIFGSGTMFSFGYTLLAGIVLNFVAGVFSTRVMLSSLAQFKPMQNSKLYHYGKDMKTMRFFEKRWITYSISFAVILVGLAGCFINGVTLDTQFKGGAVLKYNITQEVDTNAISSELGNLLQRPVSAQITTDIADSEKRLVLTLAGNTGITPDQQLQISDKLNGVFPESGATLSETFMVEPYIGQKSLQNSIIAIILSFVMIIVYVWVRFRSISGLSAGLMALIALAHDVLIVFFAFVLMKIPLNDSFVAVVLTIIGYSINDTIVIYDRIRENKKYNPKQPVRELVNSSISQTLTRSLNTTVTTAISCLLMCVFALLYGIDSIRVFAFPMTIGLICGCYSTVCIAGPLWVSWQEHKNKPNPYHASAKSTT